MPIKKYNTEEERIQARRIQQAARRRRLGKPEKKKYNSDEERKQYRAAQRKEYDKNYRKLNRDRINQITYKWKESNKEKSLAMSRKSRIRNIEKHKARWKRYYYNNLEKHKTRRSNYNKNNKLLLKMYSIKRKQLKKKIFENFSVIHIQKVFHKFNNHCFNCKSEKDLAIDHHYPLSKGFALTINNAVLLCKSCNSSKSNKLPEAFYSPEQLTDLQLNYGISKSPLKEEQPSLFEARMPKNLERDNGLLEAMNAA